MVTRRRAARQLGDARRQEHSVRRNRGARNGFCSAPIILSVAAAWLFGRTRAKELRGALSHSSGSSVALSEKELQVPGQIYVGEIVVVILLSLLFEVGQDRLRARLRRQGKESLIEMMDVLFKEITILGFIGLLVYILTQTGQADDLARWIFPGWTGEGDNPLAESFETVHMVIFCVMVVFIIQTTALTEVSQRLTDTWDGWEQAQALGLDDDSIESQLKVGGYLDASGFPLKDFEYEKSAVRRMRNDLDLHAFVMWRAIRHEFLFPRSEDKDFMHEVPNIDPVNFDFEMYLSLRLHEIFIGLVEVGTVTWVCALFLLCPILGVVISLSHEYTECIQCIAAWILFFVAVGLALNFAEMKMMLTPVLPKDPTDILQLFQGTSISEMKRRQQLEHKSFRGFDVGWEVSESQREIAAKDLGRSSLRMSGEGNVQKADAVAPFRTKDLKPKLQADGKRPWWLRMLGAKPQYVPNPQERLYLCEEVGMELQRTVLECVMFFQAILVASLIVAYYTQPITSFEERLFYLLAWSEWPLFLFAVVPRCVSRYCIMSSVEYAKDKETIEKVTAIVKGERVKQTLQMLRLVKLQGRMASLGNKPLSDDDFDDYLLRFHRLPEEQQKEVKDSFEMIDADNSGTVDLTEIGMVLSSMGLKDSSEAAEGAKLLMKVVDRDSDQVLNADEFKVLMMLALSKHSAAEEIEDLKHYFQEIDVDGNGSIHVNELAKSFAQRGIALEEDELAQLIYRCFKQFKTSLDEDEFVRWMTFCEGGST